MKIIRLLTTVFLFTLVVRQVNAQQTYFNVPSSDIVDKHKVAVQQQINIAESLRSTTTFNYGMGRNWEIGANIYNLEYSPAENRFTRNDSTLDQPYGPLLLLNTQKSFNLTENIKVAIGAQGGMNLTPKNQPKWVGYLYANLAGSLHDDHYKWSMGAYTGNPRYTGEGRRTGFQAGFDAGIFYQKVHVLGDWISGLHGLGQLVVGAEVYLGKHLPLAVGWQRTNRDGAQALVLQLTYTPD